MLKMKKQTKASWALTAILTFFWANAMAQQQDTVRTLDEVLIQDVRVSNRAPLTTSTVSKEALQEARTSVSVPYMLETQPSVVASGENGSVGATAIRIRGVDASRINVNINGITLNDAESQSVFWYNLPNLGGMAQSMQLQRGVGASTGGSPAFGAAINMQTLNAQSESYGQADFGLGSWNTRQYGLSLGTGILKSGLSFDFAYSGLTSDGFLQGGATDQQSFFGSASWYGERTLVKLLTIIGSQTTGITWDGASAADLDADETYNPSGLYDMDGNLMRYPNETDNYWQRHYQLYVSHMLTSRWNLNAALDFTHGDGYYEQYKAGKKWSKYGISRSGKTDFITQKKMFNSAYTANLSAHYSGSQFDFSVGESFLYYDGKHYGRIEWVRDTSAHLATPYQWYENFGDKIDNTVYVKANYNFNERLNAYADLQLRTINYKLSGATDDLDTMDFEENYFFFNPKAGVNYRISDNQRAYFVAGISQREPTRSDIKDALATGDTVKAEAMLDLELGYQIARNRWSFSANAYAMLYRDQLTPSGDLSSSGYALMENVDKSYRIGLELMGGAEVTRWMRVDANLTLSTNKIIDYTYTDFADGDAALQTFTANTDLSLSPSVIGAAIATFTPCKDAKVQLVGKYVGKQYGDNTSREVYAIDPYFLLNIKASYTWHLHGRNEIEAQLLVNNVLNHKYRLSAWVGDYDNGWDPVNEVETTYYVHDRGWLQQPGINVMGRVAYRF